MIMFDLVTWNMDTTTGRQYVKINSTLYLIFESRENWSQKVNGEKTNQQTNKSACKEINRTLVKLSKPDITSKHTPIKNQ